MKQFMLRLLRPAMVIMLITIVMMACQNGNDVTPADKQTSIAASKSQVIATTQDVLGITSDAMTSQGISTGRSATLNDRPHWGHHDGCKPHITGTPPKITNTKDSLCYAGSITVDYGNGGNCGGDSTKVHVHRGKIMDTFKLTAVLVDGVVVETSTETITFSGCSRDSIQLDGTIISKVAGNITTVTINNVKLTYADGSSITWSGTLTYTYDNGGTKQDLSDDTKSVTGSLSGTSNDGTAYSNTITKPILYKYACHTSNITAPASGTIEVIVGGSTSVIDYGDGTCDNAYTITANGTTTSYTFN